MSTQFRVSPATIRGRELTGTVVVYGEQAPEYQEIIRAGAFGNVPESLPVNVQHDPRLPAAEQGILTDSPAALTLRAELLGPLPGRPRGGAQWLVEKNALRGLSLEFNTLEATTDDDGNTVVLRAELLGLGLVDAPAYPSSRIQLRQRQRLTTLRGGIPAGKTLECRCGPGACKEALFEQGALDSLIAPGRKGDTLAVAGEYSAALASQKRRSVRFWNDGNGGLQYAVDIPNSDRGRALLDTMDSVDIFGRPVIDLDASDFTRDGTLARYTRAEIRALTVGATDAAAGWTALRVADPDELEPEQRANPPKDYKTRLRKRRRMML